MENNYVNEINKLLNSSNQTDSTANRSLAHSYAEACVLLNNRINSCIGLLKDHNVEAAVSEAKREPDIWTMAKNLQISQPVVWRDLCELYDWDIPDAVNTAFLNRIKQELVTGNTLQPMLNYYRSHIRQMSVTDKVLLLRKIIKMEPGNKQWTSDLKSLETEYILELESRAKAAITNHDADALTLIYEEITDPAIKNKIKEKMISGCKSKLEQFNGEALQEKGNKILLDIDNAYAMQEREELQAALSRWEEEIENHEYFEFSGLSVDRLADPRIWLEEQNAIIQKQKDYEQLINNFTIAMDNNESVENLETIYFKFNAYDEGVPFELNSRYNNIVENYQIQQNRRQRIIIVSSITAFICIAVIALLIVSHYQFQQKRETRIVQLESLLNKKAIDEGVKILNYLKKNEPKIYKYPKVQDINNSFVQLKEADDIRKSDLKRHFGIMEEIVLDNFKEKNIFEDHLKKASSLAVKIAEKAKLNSYKDAYKKYLNDIEEQKEAEFLIKVDNLLAAICKFEKIYLNENKDKFAAKIKDFSEKTELLNEQNIDSDQKLKSINTLRRKLDSLKSEYGKNLKYRQEIAKNLKAVIAAVQSNDLPSLQTAMQAYQSSAKRTDGKFAKPLANIALADNLALLARYNTNTPTSIKVAWQEIQDVGEKNNPWYQPAKQLFNASKPEQNSLIVGLLQEIKFPFLDYFRLQFIDKRGRRYCFYAFEKPSRFLSNKEENIVIKTRSPSNQNCNMMFTCKNSIWSTNRKSILLANYELVKGYVPSYRKAWRDLIADIAKCDTNDIEINMIKWIQEMSNASDINPIIKYQLISRVLTIWDKAYGETPMRTKYFDQLRKIQKFILKNDLNIFRLSSEDYYGMNQLIKNISLDKVYANVKVKKANNELLRYIVGVQLSWAGMVIEGESGPVPIIGIKNNILRKLWILHVESPQKIYFKNVGSIQYGTFYPSTPKVSLSAGCYLFAPSSKTDTRLFAEKIKKEYDLKGLQWPELWPVNCR